MSSSYRLIAEAIRSQRNISFDYKDVDEKYFTPRVTSPHFITKNKKGRFYIFSRYVRGHTKPQSIRIKERCYIIEQMRNIKVLDEHFDVDPMLKAYNREAVIIMSVFNYND